MLRTPLLLAATLCIVAAPAAAQDTTYTWTTDRPDGVAPARVFADRALDDGAVEITGVYTKMDRLGVRFGTQFLTVDQTLDLFSVAPLTLSDELLEVRLGFGLGEGMSLVARTGFVSKRREQVTNDNFFVLESDGIADTEVHLLWESYADDAIRAHLQAGVLIPTGSVEETGDAPGIRTGILPYDMQPGVGSFGVLPGFTVQMQNRNGSVGAQVVGRVYVGENDRGWKPGNAVEANGWAAYRFNDYFSVNAGVRAVGWGSIEDADASLDPFRDPGELATSYGGSRVDLPVGLNVHLRDGPLAGHRLGVEWVSNVHEDLDGPWLAADNGWVFSWRAAVGG